MMEILKVLINGALFSVFATTLATPPGIPTPTITAQVEVQGQQRPLWPCWPTDILIITFLLYCQACNQWIPRPAFVLHLHLYWGLYGAALLRYIKTAAPWSNEQIPPGSAKGYPTSVNNAAFKHQSYAKRLVHRGGDGRQEKAEKQGLDWRDNERGSTQENISNYLTLRCQLLHSFMMKI